MSDPAPLRIRQVTHFHGIPFRVRTALLAGGVVAYPTEGVYGLGCLPIAHRAIERILAIKARSASKGLILIADNAEQLLPWVAIDEVGGAKAFIRALRDTSEVERACTFVVPAASGCPALITGGRETIAVRVTRHPTAAALCRVANSALISTSANDGGKAPITRPALLRRSFRGAVDAICARANGDQRGVSRIVELASGRVIRA